MYRNERRLLKKTLAEYSEAVEEVESIIYQNFHNF